MRDTTGSEFSSTFPDPVAGQSNSSHYRCSLFCQAGTAHHRPRLQSTILKNVALMTFDVGCRAEEPQSSFFLLSESVNHAIFDSSPIAFAVSRE